MNRDDVVQFLLEQEKLPFEWGKTDCAQVAAGMREIATGVRPAMPAYSSEMEAKRWLAAAGGLEAAVSGMLGPAQSDLRLCGDGDIVLSAFDQGQTLGVCVGRLVFLRRQRDGKSDFDPSLVPVDIETAGIRWWPCRSS